MSKQLLLMMTADQVNEFAYLLAEAECGDGDAACRLGDMYREGSDGLRYSPKKTFHWYARSALAGDANGQNNLGACYEHGLGCKQSYAKAVRWYRLAAAQDLGTATMNLGCCYAAGHGVSLDRQKAVELFRTAVGQGEEKALEELERLGVSADTKKAPNVRVRRGVTIVDVTDECPGQLFGLVGATGVRPPVERTVRTPRAVKEASHDESPGVESELGKAEGEG